MRILRNKFKVSTIALVLLLMASVMLMAMPVLAQLEPQPTGSVPLPSGVTPDLTLDTKAYLSFRPNPVGVGQTILVNIWLTPPLNVVRHHTRYTVTITKPDGSKVTVGPMDSYSGDTTAWFEYVVDQVGTWKLKFDFPGGYFAAGIYTIPGRLGAAERTATFVQSVYYKPSSTAEQELTVQEEMVYSWPPSPLPTDYWTRPVSPEHREWWSILGNYPGTGYPGGGGPVWDELYPGTNPYEGPRYGFHPWVIAPNTAHIVWKRLGAVAGLIGGPAYYYSITSSPGSPDLIYAGRCYDTQTVPVNGMPTSCAVCYDLRTGEMYYAIPTAQGGVTPNIISYVDPARIGIGEVPGADPTSASAWSVELLSISGGYLRKVHPWTGALSLNVSIAPLTGSGGTYYRNGYVLAVRDLGAAAGAERYRLINWTTFGTTPNFTERIISNTTYARSSLPTLIDYNAGIGAVVGSITTNATGVSTGATITAYKLTTGEQLWNITIDGEAQYSGSCAVADHGKVAYLVRGGGYFLAYDLYSGKLAWKSEAMDYPWGEAAFGAYAIQSAYGMLFRQSYAGVYAFDWETGKIVWKYVAQALSPYETPYTDVAGGQTVYSFNSGGVIADGKMYVVNSEHTATQPATRGWKLHCINITTGEGIWNITGPMSPGAMADGYLTAANSRDGYMYVFGKGKSVTTVSAPQTTIAKGTSVLITGTVLDQSPAQPGTPCVSKESMATYMEYLHMQMPIGGIWGNETITGVPVILTAIGSDGTVIDIGKTTTNGYYGTFSYTWTPPDEDTYTIIASFSGDDSYGSSSSATGLSVGPAPEAPPAQEEAEAADYTPIFIGIIAAVVAVAILVVYAIIAIRKLRK